MERSWTAITRTGKYSSELPSLWSSLISDLTRRKGSEEKLWDWRSNLKKTEYFVLVTVMHMWCASISEYSEKVAQSFFQTTTKKPLNKWSPGHIPFYRLAKYNGTICWGYQILPSVFYLFKCTTLTSSRSEYVPQLINMAGWVGWLVAWLERTIIHALQTHPLVLPSSLQYLFQCMITPVSCWLANHLKLFITRSFLTTPSFIPSCFSFEQRHQFTVVSEQKRHWYFTHHFKA